MSDRQQSKWAVVTGSSSGIGKATALQLAADGWNVGVHCRSSRSAAEQVVEQIRQMGRNALLLQADFANFGSGERVVDEAWKQAGSIDAWIHFAGADLLTGPGAKLTCLEKLEVATRVDLWGTIETCRAAGRRMFEQSRGTILTMGWDQAATGMEGDSGEIFAAVKGGVMAFTRSLAKSLAPRVRVNCIAPGWIKTAWGEGATHVWQDRVLRETPLARWGTPQDIAGAAAFLVSDRAGFLTGQTIAVNGGVVTS